MPERTTNKSDLKSAHAVPQEQLPPITVSLKELSAECHRYIVYPPFQRQSVWPLRLCQAYIDSILLGDPSPPPEGYQEFSATGEVIWGIIDGHSRITAILDFIDGKYKTWTQGQKRHSEPNSELPVQPGKFFHELDAVAKNYFLDYRLQINKVRKRPEKQMVTRFLRVQNHVPLSAAEKLNAYTSRAKEVAKQIKSHPFWEDFYEGRTNREQIFQSSLHLLALELNPNRMIDLQGASFLHGLASGAYDSAITDTVVNTVSSRLDSITHLYAGTHFTERAVVIAMYQSIMLLERAGYDMQRRDKGQLTNWISAIISESKRVAGTPGYRRPIQRLTYAGAQQEFWDKHRKTVLSLCGMHTSEDGHHARDNIALEAVV